MGGGGGGAAAAAGGGGFISAVRGAESALGRPAPGRPRCVRRARGPHLSLPARAHHNGYVY